MPRARWLLAVLVLVAVIGCRRGSPRGTVKVAAAADLSRAFTEVGKAFTARTGTPVVFTFGSSGLLAKQLAEGAPFDLYAAASRQYVTQVVDAGACDGATRSLYGIGRLVVWTKGAPIAKLEELAEARFAKIAIANPDHAPYGKAAREALQQAGVWDRVADRMVFGENVQATMQWAQDGSADAAVVALSLATVTTGGTSLPVDPALHAPLEQELVVCGKGDGKTGSKAGATAFAAFVASPEGRDIMRNYGFRLPGE